MRGVLRHSPYHKRSCAHTLMQRGSRACYVVGLPAATWRVADAPAILTSMLILVTAVCLLLFHCRSGVAVPLTGVCLIIRWHCISANCAVTPRHLDGATGAACRTEAEC